MNKKQSLRSIFTLVLSLLFIYVSALGCSLVKQAESKSPDKNTNRNSTENSSPATGDNKDAGKLFNTNLIKDGNAEAESHTAWKPSEDLKTIIYGDFGGGPGKDSPGPANRGEKYFYANISKSKPTAVFKQTIDVGIGAAIDKGIVNYNFGGWFGSANGSLSSGRLKVAFLDKDGKEISKDETAEIKESERPEDGVMLERNKSGNLPVGTRRIEVSLEFHIYPGRGDEELDNLSFADNLSFVLTQRQ